MAKDKAQSWFQQIPIEIYIFPILFILGLGTLPLLGPDEPRYAQVAREMFERNDWITPTLGGFHWFEKPALLYWLQIVNYYIFGVNEFAARFGSALFGLLTVFAVYLLYRKTVEDESYADWAFIITASCLGLIVFSRAATFDIILTFPITAALVCFFLAQSSKFKVQSLKFLAGFYFFIGVALLAKGLIGAVLPFGIIFWYFVAARKLPSKNFLVSLLWGGFVTSAVAATWYLPMYLRHGWEFIDEFFVQHHFARYTSNKYAHPEPFWFFWVILPALTLPWLPFFLAAIWKTISRKGKQAQSLEEGTPPLQDIRIFAFVWVLVPVVFFSFSGSKLPGYILPALPAALILAAEQVKRFTNAQKTRALIVRVTAWVILIGIFIAAEVLPATDFVKKDTKKYLVQTAAEQGYKTEKVLNLHDISHSLEFYAANRLARTPEGRQIKFEGVGEIAQYLRKNNEQKALVIVPLEYEYQLKEAVLLQTNKITDNGAFALFAVELR
jgi:4-amino-4-deoxy-L-arabinose transferase-like glycosyltransferase